MYSYILITPAHNEVAFIEKAIRSVLAQTVRPLKWIIVDDASVDGTAELIDRYAKSHCFIEAVHLKRCGGRDFGKKVEAFNAGLWNVQDIDYQFIGNLDADISLKPDYYSRILQKFAESPGLGIAGGMVHSLVGRRFISQEVSQDSVDGAVQLFRRECYEQIGGYIALPNGGIDAAAEIVARMHGWRVRTYPDIIALEHRRTGWFNAEPLAARMKEGQRLYSLGYGGLFMFARCVYRMAKPPIIFGGIAAFFGYINCRIHAAPIVLPPAVVRFLQREQRAKLKRLLSRIVQVPELRGAFSKLKV